MSFKDLLPSGVVSLLPSKSLEALILAALRPSPCLLATLLRPHTHGEHTGDPFLSFLRGLLGPSSLAPLLHFLFQTLVQP